MNTKKLAVTIGVTALSLTINTSIYAATISVNTSAGIVGGSIDSNSQSASSGSLSSTSTDVGGSGLDFNGAAIARAAANINGQTAVSAEGVYACGICNFELVANSLFETGFTNNSAGAVNFTYDFFISGPSVELVDFANITELAGLVMHTEANVIMSTTGGANDSFFAMLDLTGGDASHTVNAVGGTESFFTTTDGFGYSMGNLTGSFSGMLAAGESVTFETSLLASVVGPGFEVGGRASIGDPNNLTITPVNTLTVVSAVPVPAAIWLFGSGLIGLIGFARRK
jgi:hypothetical protein